MCWRNLNQKCKRKYCWTRQNLDWIELIGKTLLHDAHASTSVFWSFSVFQLQKSCFKGSTDAIIYGQLMKIIYVEQLAWDVSLWRWEGKISFLILTSDWFSVIIIDIILKSFEFPVWNVKKIKFRNDSLIVHFSEGFTESFLVLQNWWWR